MATLRARLSAIVTAASALAMAPAAAAETITFENETTPYPGVTVLERHTTGPNWRIWVARVALCDQGVHVDARPSEGSRTSAASWGASVGAQLAVNGDFYRTDRSTPTVYGDAVGGGVRWPTARTGLAAEFDDDWYHDNYGWIAFGDDWVEFSHTEYVKRHADELGVSQGWYPREVTSQIPAGTRALVSGFSELVVEGTAMTSFPDRGDLSDRHPRTAMGLTRDRDQFMLVVVDGRSSQSVGMNGVELASLMASLGAENAFNLDGGGSSQMWLSGTGTLNNPSDGSPRSVANHWGIFAGAGHNLGSEPGSCFVAGGCFPSPIPEASGSAFADLPSSSDRLADASLVVDQGLVETCQSAPEPMFCPACSMTRRTAVSLVVRAAGVDTSNPPGSPTFSDVPADDPAFAEIEAAAATGITVGCGSGKFCPDNAVTRAQLATLIGRAQGWDLSARSSSRFADVATDHQMQGAIESLAEHCAALECSEQSFCPDAPVRRDDAAAIAVRAFDLDGASDCSGAAPDPDDPGGDGDGGSDGGAGDDDPSGGPDPMLGGCATAGSFGGGPALAFVLVFGLLGRRRRRR